jgi:ubiquitin carboxyl-terminal hydrolase L5
LDNLADAARKRGKAPPKKKKKSSKSEPEGFHYIAFVPVDGQVWELDGLENMPLCLGMSPQALYFCSITLTNHLMR